MDGTLHMLQELDGDMLGSAFSSSMMLTGDAEEYVKDEYAKLDGGLEENRKDGTAARLLAACSTDRKPFHGDHKTQISGCGG